MAEPPKPGSIVHVEFHVKEPKKVEKFYASPFGWKFQEVPGMNYSIFQAPSGPGGGIGGLQPGNWASGVINYIAVNSVEEYQEKSRRPAERSSHRRMRSRARDGSPSSRIPPGRGWPCGSRIPTPRTCSRNRQVLEGIHRDGSKAGPLAARGRPHPLPSRLRGDRRTRR